MRRNGKRSYQKTDREDPGAEVVAVSDVFEESAKKAAEICGAKSMQTVRSSSMQRT